MTKPDKSQKILFITDSFDETNDVKKEKEKEGIVKYLTISKQYVVTTNLETNWIKSRSNSRDNLFLVDRFSKEDIGMSIENADSVIIEASNETFELFSLLNKTINYRKPVLILSKNKDHSELISSSFYFAEKYNDRVELPNILNRFFRSAEEHQKTERFHLSLSRDQKNYLVRVSRSKNCSIAEYLRTLIEKEIVRSQSQ
ncbi:hypothetical protein GF389_06385 [Candidatus Dojkabacteria bacterium]|nr:hypothetical protein [Candidatus Dojkabacteria bacterium]